MNLSWNTHIYMHLIYCVKISCETDLYYKNYITKHSNNTFFDVKNKKNDHAQNWHGCSLTHGTNVDSLYKNPKITLFRE